MVCHRGLRTVQNNTAGKGNRQDEWLCHGFKEVVRKGLTDKARCEWRPKEGSEPG